MALADVMALQEVDRFWRRSGMVDAPAELGRHLPEHRCVYGVNLDMDSDFTDVEGRVVHRRRQFGTMILSCSPILSNRNHLLPKYGMLTQHSIQQGTLEAVIEACFFPLRVHSVHLSHLDAAARLPQLAALLDIRRRAPAAILMGDFKFKADGPEYAAMVGPLSERYGRLANTDGVVDSWSVAGHDEADGVTCDGKRLDYPILAQPTCASASAVFGSTASPWAPITSPCGWS